MGGGAASTEVAYPRHPIVWAAPDSAANSRPPHVVMLFIDSWSRETFSPECTPNAWAFAQEADCFDNHLSCSNGTRSSIFTTFFSVPDIYWRDFEAEAIRPVLFDVLDSLGYAQRLFPSATLQNPPLGRVVFPRVPVCCSQPEGATVYERDCRATADFCAFADTVAAEPSYSARPTFSFVFLDLAHSYEMPEQFKQRFQPSWSYADYSQLGPDTDPTPFFNLYRNCVYQADSLVGIMLNKIDEVFGPDNTLVIISGDHSQEFNENHKNFWGHNGNFSRYQIGVPLAVRFPARFSARFSDGAPRHHTHRTTHYDLAPTILGGCLGVQNQPEDYSLGRCLTDTTGRDHWHIVGSELNFAFIAEGDTIIEKTAEGGMDVFDARMNDVFNYHLNPRKFNKATERMQSFYK